MRGAIVSIFLTVVGLILAPIIIIGLILLAAVAIVISTLTSSFILIRLMLLLLGVISSLTITSSNWLLSSVVHTLGRHMWGWSHQPNQSVIHQRILEQQKVSSSLARRRRRSMGKLDIPERYAVKNRRSISNPGTPIGHRVTYFDTATNIGLEMTRPQIVSSI